MTIPLKQHLWIAFVVGTALSGMLFALNLTITPDHHPTLIKLLFVAQYPGWIACAIVIPGSFESTSTAAYLGIAVPANAILYSAAVFTALRCAGAQVEQN